MDSENAQTKKRTFSKNPAPEEPVWTYRGYSLRASEFVSAMAHLFRAEVQRANVWRQRLDTTTNWAVVSTGAVLSLAFSQPNSHHSVIILNMLLVTWFLITEARRYRYYELWSYRIRLMETDFYAAMLVPPFHPSPEWGESLAENLLSPSFPISNWEAFGRRLRRNYLFIYLILGVSWLAKNWLFPFPPLSMTEYLERAALGSISGQAVLALVALSYGVLLLIAVATIGMNQAAGEVLPRFGEEGARAFHERREGEGGFRLPLFPHHRRRQMLAFIVTDKAKPVAERIMTDLRRGVTSMPATGMYTGQGRSVLICALTVTEVHNLKTAVAKEDPQAFLIVSPAQEILGRGFAPLADKKP